MTFNKDDHLFNASEEKSDDGSSVEICCGHSQNVHFKRMVVLVAAAALGLATAVALFVVAGLFGAQETRLKHLQDENELLKFQNEALKNEITDCQSRATDSANELQNVKHLLDLSDAKCNLEKANISDLIETKGSLEKANISSEIEARCDLEKNNISNHLLSEFDALKAEKQTLELNLLECQGRVKDLTDNKSSADAQNAAERQELDRCYREKDELLARVSEQANQLPETVTCQPCSSPAVQYQNDEKGGPASVAPSSSSRMNRVNRPPPSFALFAFLLLASFHFHA